jgi:hypothetical protein
MTGASGSTSSSVTLARFFVEGAGPSNVRAKTDGFPATASAPRAWTEPPSALPTRTCCGAGANATPSRPTGGRPTGDGAQLGLRLSVGVPVTPTGGCCSPTWPATAPSLPGVASTASPSTGACVLLAPFNGAPLPGPTRRPSNLVRTGPVPSSECTCPDPSPCWLEGDAPMEAQARREVWQGHAPRRMVHSFGAHGPSR